MLKSSIIISGALLLLAHPCLAEPSPSPSPSLGLPAPELSLSMVTATSIKDELPFVLFTGGKFRADPDAEFVKLHMHFDEPEQISRIEVDHCDKFKAHVMAYFNFDERLAWADAAGNKTASADTWDPYGAPEFGKVSSITLNFRDNTPLCLSAIRLYTKTQQFKVNVPRIVKGTISANSTLAPAESYDVMNLFDSRFEYAWSSDALDKGVVFDIKFEKEETIKKLRIWNGYQRTASHCYSNGRLKELKLEGEGGYSETVKVADQMGSQIIELSKPFTGKSLKLTSLDAYKGRKYKDLVISELRFHDGKGWFMLSPLARAQEIAKRNREAFESVKLGAMVNHNFKTPQPSAEVLESSEGYDTWTFRFREDGSFFADGAHHTEEGAGYTSSALGNYEVKSKSSDKLELRLFGSVRKLRNSQDELDCNGCGRACNSPADEAKEGRIFQDFVTLSKIKDGGYVSVTNTSKGPKVLTFKPLKLLQAQGDEYSP